MTRYLKFDTGFLNFPTRADVNFRKDYFTDFTFGGQRDRRIYGLTKCTPQITVAYDMDGLNFLQYVIGGSGGVFTPADVPEIGTIWVGIDDQNFGIINAKVDTWEMNVEGGNPARAEWTAIGKGTFGSTLATYTPNFGSGVIMPSSISVSIGASSIDFSRLNLRVSNALDIIFKSSTLPATIRPTGLEVTGRIRVPYYNLATVVDGSISIKIPGCGTISLPICKITEIPARATGFNLPETEFSFTGFPGAGATDYAISATASTITINW